MGMLHESMRAAPRRPRRRELPARTPTSPPPTRSGYWSSKGTRQHRRADARRPGGRDHAVERAVHAVDVEAGAGAGRRQHGRSSSRPSGRRCRARCSPTSPSRPGSRPACSTSCRASARRSARRSSATRGCKRISFTGSPETARHIGRAAAENIVPFTAELGGKGPLIVFADADLDAAAAQGRRAVRRLRPGLPRRHPAARRGVGPRRVPRPLRRRRRRATCSATAATRRRRSPR